MLPNRDRKGVGAFLGFSQADTVYRLVTVTLQLLALILMRITFFGDFHLAEIKPVAARARIKAYLTALKTYKEETGDFPTASQGLQALVRNPGVTHWQGPYVDKPISNDPWGHPYIYRYRPGQEPEIVSLGSDGRPGPNNISNLTPAVPQARFRPMEYLPLGVFLLSTLTFFGLFFLPRLLRKRNVL
jgi:general secretion pathway protein G